MSAHLLGLRTLMYKTDDLERSKAFYTAVLGFEPYFDEPFYVGYNVGGFELGLDPDMTDVVKGSSEVGYWGVDNIENSLKAIIAAGGELADEIQEVGGGIKVASVKDPSGNIFGIIENPHFKIEV